MPPSWRPSAKNLCAASGPVQQQRARIWARTVRPPSGAACERPGVGAGGQHVFDPQRAGALSPNTKGCRPRVGRNGPLKARAWKKSGATGTALTRRSPLFGSRAGPGSACSGPCHSAPPCHMVPTAPMSAPHTRPCATASGPSLGDTPFGLCRRPRWSAVSQRFPRAGWQAPNTPRHIPGHLAFPCAADLGSPACPQCSAVTGVSL